MDALRRFFLVGVFFTLLSGQGGCVIDCDISGCLDGCAGCDCSSCGCDCASCQECGLEPIPGGFSSSTVGKAAQLRFTDSGLSFIETNGQDIVESLAGAVMDTSQGLVFPIPPINQEVEEGLATVTGCSLVEYPIGSGQQVESCYIRSTLTALNLTPVDGTQMIEVRVGVALETLTIDTASGLYVPAPIHIDNISVIILGNQGGCDVTFTNTTVDYRIEIGFSSIPAGQIFEGYSQLDVGNHDFVGGAAAGGLQASTISENGCPNDFFIPLPPFNIHIDYPGTIAASGNSSIPGIVDQIGGFLCYQVADPGFCPTGSTPVDLGTGTAFTCTENGGPNGGNCVPLMLGSENRINFGTLLASISPGSPGQADMVLAISDALADNTGYTMNFLSGAEPSVDGIIGNPADCIPASALAAARPVPMPTSVPDFNSDTGPHHMAFGISEDYGDYFFDGLWRGGAFCMQIGTGAMQELNTGLLALLIPDLAGLAFPESSAPIVVDVRPLSAPDVTVGTGTVDDPTIQVAMNNLDVDFYVWSSERFVRIMTLNNDFKLGLNIAFDNATGDISLTIDQLAMENATVHNDELLAMDTTNLGESIAGLLGGPLVGMFLPEGGIPAFSLPDLGSLTLDLDITQSDEAGERFLATYITMGGDFSNPMPLGKRADTTVEVTRVDTPDETPFRLATLGQGELPSIEVAMAGSGFDEEYEFSYRVDGMDWSAWTRSRYAVIDGQGLLLQGHHTVDARARAVGVPFSSDMSPASAEFVIDIDAPSVEVQTSADGTTVRVDDIVSSVDALEYRWRQVGGEWSAWATLGTHELTIAEATGLPGSVEVQVRDEVGNVGGAEEDLRGLPASDAGGCGGCSSVGSDLPLAGFGVLVMFGMLISRRRREDI